MKYISTRGEAPAVNLSAALAAGLAPDGGLYVPQTLPRFVASDFAGCETLAAVSARLLAPFFAGDALASQLDAICESALDIPVPLVPWSADGRKAAPKSNANSAYTTMLELFHGPTCAFKDFGVRFLAGCLTRLRGQSDPLLTILVATSGDTGAAVAAAFHRMPGFDVVILYPDGHVSLRQAHQLGCFRDNVSALRIAGSFDDCQRLVKQALADTGLQSRVPLSSANSISLGRLLPQMGYYALAALMHWRVYGRKLGFIVPTGNLGNALACVLARAMGLPIGEIVLSTNANRILPDFFAGADYAPRASIATLANAMDVGAPSNFERLHWLFPDPQDLRCSLRAVAIDDESIRSTIRDSYVHFGTAVCPHTATAVCVLESLRSTGETADYAVVATAHPAKFEQVIEPLIGTGVKIPQALARLLKRPSSTELLPANYAALHARLLS